MTQQTLKLLLVEDDEVDRMAVVFRLKKAGLDYEIDEAETCVDAMKHLEQHHYDCALIDYHLTDGDGLELLKFIRGNDIDTAVVILTGRGDEELVVEMMRSGADNYISKGKITPESLAKAIHNAITHHRDTGKEPPANLTALPGQPTTTILENITDAFFAIDRNWRFIYVNSQAEKLLNKPRHLLLDQSLWETLPRLGQCFSESFRRVMATKREEHLETFYPAGQRWLEMHLYPSDDGFSAYFQDITQRKLAEQRIRFLATHDMITGTLNRDVLREQLSHAINRHAGGSQYISVLYLDITNFKDITGTFGLDTGDELLREVTRRLRDCCAGHDMIARISGHEFVIVCTNLDNPQLATDYAQAINNTFLKPVRTSGHDIPVTTAIGISIYPCDSETPDTLLRNADIAMQHAKTLGSHGFETFSPAMCTPARDRLITVAELHEALQKNELAVHYAPIVTARSGKIVGAETFLYWQHPRRGLQPVERFNTTPGANNLGSLLNNWFLETLAGDVDQWQRMGFKDLRIVVNLDKYHASLPQWIQQVRDMLAAHPFDVSWLQLALSQDRLARHLTEVDRLADTLRNLGLSLAIENLNTSAASLAFLQQCAIRHLRISPDLVAELAREPKSRDMIASIITLGQRLGLETEAHGVTLATQADLLTGFGCDFLQGEYFGGSAPSPVFTTMLNNNRRRADVAEPSPSPIES